MLIACSQEGFGMSRKCATLFTSTLFKPSLLCHHWYWNSSPSATSCGAEAQKQLCIHTNGGGGNYVLFLLAVYVLYCQCMKVWAILLVTVITVGCKTCFAAAGHCSFHLGLQMMTRQALCLVTWQWHLIWLCSCGLRGKRLNSVLRSSYVHLLENHRTPSLTSKVSSSVNFTRCILFLSIQSLPGH
jgi:hypothetical protein